MVTVQCLFARMDSMAYFHTMIKISIIGLFIILSACSAGNSGEVTASEDIRNNFTLRDQQNNEVVLSDTTTWLFVNFWATWCKPCITEMPSIVELRDSLSEAPIMFMLITNETPGQTGNFLSERNIDIPSYHMINAVEAFELIGFPTTLLINPEGRIVMRSEGAENWIEKEDEIRRLINASQSD